MTFKFFSNSSTTGSPKKSPVGVSRGVGKCDLHSWQVANMKSIANNLLKEAEHVFG